MDQFMQALLRGALQDDSESGSSSGQQQQQQQGAQQSGQQSSDGDGDDEEAQLLHLLGALVAHAQSSGLTSDIGDPNEDDANADSELVSITSACRDGDFEELKSAIQRIKESQGQDVVYQLVNNPNRARRTPLMITASTPGDGSRECAAILIQEGANPVQNDMAGNTALHLSLEHNNVPVAKLLIDKGAQVDGKNQKNQLPAHLAAKSGHAASLQLLKERKADLDCVDDDGDTPLHFACLCENYEAVEMLLNCKVQIDKPNKEGMTPLWLACAKENVDIVKLLISRGAKLDHLDAHKRGPLHVAAAKSETVAAFLLEKGCKADLPDEKGFTPLHVACLEGFSSLVEKMLQTPSGKKAVRMVDSEGRNALLFACNRGRDECARLLIKNGAEVNNTDKNGMPPLLHCVNSSSSSCIAALVQGGADLEMKDRVNGFTALLLAVANGERECMHELLKHGAKADAISAKYAHNAFHIVAIKGNSSIIGEFVKWVEANTKDGKKKVAAMIKVGDTDGDTPLHLATQRKHVDVVQELMKHGAIARMANGTGFTALQIAARQGSLEIVQLLLKKKPQEILEVAKADGFRAIHLASLNGFWEIVRELINKGAEINPKTQNGQTPLMLACSRSQIEVIRELLKQKNKIKLEETDKDGETALIFALRAKDQDPTVLTLLMDAGADILTRANDKECVLHYIVRAKRVELAKSVLERTSSTDAKFLVNCKGSTGWTALHLAAKMGETPLVEVLLDYGAEVDEKKDDGYTALHLAALNGQTESCRMLLAFGADPEKKNSENKTAKELAAKERKSEVVRMFEAASSNPPERRYPKALQQVPQRRRSSLLGRLTGSGSGSAKGQDSSKQLQQGAQGSAQIPHQPQAQASEGKHPEGEAFLTRERRRSLSQAREGRLSIHKVLDEVGHGSLAEKFVENGFENSSSWKHLSPPDMESWGIKKGHARQIHERMRRYTLQEPSAATGGSASGSGSSTRQRPGLLRGDSRSQRGFDTDKSSQRGLNQQGSVRFRKKSHGVFIVSANPSGSRTVKFSEMLQQKLKNTGIGSVITQDTAEDWQSDINDCYAVVVGVTREFVDAVDNNPGSDAFLQFFHASKLPTEQVIMMITEEDMRDEKSWGNGMFGSMMRQKLQKNMIGKGEALTSVKLIQRIADAKKYVESSTDDEEELLAF